MGKTTTKLTEQLNNTSNLTQFLQINEEHFSNLNLTEYLKKLLEEKHMKKSDVIDRSHITPSYGYDIFSQGKHPSRDKILSLCFGFQLTSEEANHLLHYATLSELYPRIRRDSIIMFALNSHKTIDECNALLNDAKETEIESSSAN